MAMDYANSYLSFWKKPMKLPSALLPALSVALVLAASAGCAATGDADKDWQNIEQASGGRHANHRRTRHI
jgi:hypothetical protein